MAKKELDEQLQAFFEHNPLDDDMLYLKSYVKEHPDNKMGWYLLGKEYAARNKEGKAKYCFAQAGEVYEAFEKQKIRLGPFEELKADKPVLPGQTDRRRPLFRTLRLSAALMMALLLGSYLNVDKAWVPSEDGEEATKVVEQEERQAPVPADTALETRILYRDPLRADEGIWKQFLLGGKDRSAGTILAEGKLTTDGKWVNGIRQPALLATGRVSAENGGLQVVYHQAELCNCTPGKDEEAEKALEEWVKLREETVIVESAVRAYLARYGEPLPASLDGLVRDFPHNILPGYTESMAEIYRRLMADGQAGGTATPLQDGADRKRPAGTLTEGGYLEAPLEIIVDKAAFRLALVSGDVILRSYPVGLGGPRTPEGVFHITDKVKNPNGRDDGDFGSRGMQLSDTDYAIHGTNEPRSIGDNRSLGCIRMLKEDIEELFDMAPSGTKVTIGTGLLPADTLRKEKPFRMPSLREERNPNKIYRWLD